MTFYDEMAISNHYQSQLIATGDIYDGQDSKEAHNIIVRRLLVDIETYFQCYFCVSKDPGVPIEGFDVASCDIIFGWDLKG